MNNVASVINPINNLPVNVIFGFAKSIIFMNYML